jgi:uncharacterized membrane protein HdeD (DUF308 family)
VGPGRQGWPGIKALVLLDLIAAWMVVTGVLEVAAAFILRRELRGGWLLALAGILSVILGRAAAPRRPTSPAPEPINRIARP